MHGSNSRYKVWRQAATVLVCAALLTADDKGGKAQERNGHAASGAGPASTTPTALPPALRIVKLLWKTQPQSAGNALTKAIDQSLSRRQLDELRPHFVALAPQLEVAVQAGPRDVRWVPAIAALALSGDEDGVRSLAHALTAGAADGESASGSGQQVDKVALKISDRDLLLRIWLQIAPRDAVAYVVKVIGSDRPVDSAGPSAAIEWLETAALLGLQTEPQTIAKLLVERWDSLPKSVRVAAIEPLSSQASTMQVLVSAIEKGTIAKDLVNTNQLLKWSNGSETELAASIERVWGKLRVGDDAERKAVVARMLTLLNSGKSGNPVAGQQNFKRICAQCHRLHGEGIEVGPDITGNGRGSFEQLVSNVMDPSLVIGKAFLAKTVLTYDGRVLAGLVSAEDERRLTLKIQGGKLVELDREEDIDEIKESTKSLMPDGLEQQMSEQELIDLFAFLSLTQPLTAPENDTIPGTPTKLLGQ